MPQSEPRALPGYEYVGTVNTDDLCDFLFSKDSKLNRKSREITEFNLITLGCVGISAAGLAASGPAALIPITICGGSVAGCAVRNTIENATACGDLLIDVYVVEDLNKKTPQGAGIVGTLALRCESGALQATIDDVVNEAEEYTDAGLEIADNIVDETYEDAEYIINEGSDFTL